MRDLNNSLYDYHPAMLEIVALHWGIELTSAHKREMVTQLAEEMTQPVAVARILETLTKEERAALDEVITAQGVVKAAPYLRQHGEIRSFGPGSLRREQPWRAPVSLAESLWYRGLIYKGFARLDEHIGEVIFIPADLLTLLPATAPPPVALQLTPTTAPARTHTTALVWDIFALLTHLQRESARLGAQRAAPLPKATQQAVLARWRDKDVACLDFVYHLVTQLELIELKVGAHDRAPLLKPSVAARRWLKSAPASRWRTLRAAWRADSDWDELCHISTLQCETADKRQSDPSATRQNFLNLLAQCPAQEWLSIEAFIQAVKSTAPDFQRPDGNYRTWYIRDTVQDEYLVGFEHWDRVEGRLIHHYLTQPVAWLGIVDLGYDDDNTVVSFRITASGMNFLSEPSRERLVETEAPPAPSLTIHEDFTITVPPDFALYDHYQLERLADRTVEDQPDRYKLSRDRVEAIFQQNVEVENILTFLRRVSHDRVPVVVVQNLRQWAAKYEAITLERVILLHTWDAVTMHELRAAPQLQPYLGATVDECSVIVATADVDEVTALLRELGYWAQIGK